MTLVKDWIAFCEGEKSFDKSHFLTLFHAEHDEETLKSIFYFFSSSDELVDRMLSFMSARKTRLDTSKNNISDQKLVDLAEQDMKAKSAILEASGEVDIAKLANDNKALITTDKSLFSAAANMPWPNGEKQIAIADYVLDHWRLRDNKTFALFEALYGAANFYDVQYFLAAPLIDLDVNFDLFFEIWSAGANTALTENSILILKRESVATTN